MNKVYELMDECAAKIEADGVAEAKAYKEYFEWCDETAKNAGFDIKTAASAKEKLEAKIGKLTSDIGVSTQKVEDLTAAIAANDADLKAATGVREKEAADFAAAEAELVDGVDTLGRAIGIIEREMAKGASAFAQIDTANLNKMTQALSTVMEAAGMTGSDRGKLTALLQSQDDDDDEETGAPAAAAYESKSGGIVDVLNSMKEKAEGELADLRKAEGAAQQNFNMLKGSLEGKIGADTKDLDGEKSAIAEANQAKSEAEGDLSMTTKDLAAANNNLATVHGDCLTVASDHETTVAARAEELKVIATAKKILEESTGGAVSQSYSLLQIKMKSNDDLKNNEVVAAVKKLAKQHGSVKLAQLASKIGSVITYGGTGVFDKITGLINDMIAKLEKEAEEDAGEKAYCDEEMAKTEAKKSELDDDIDALTAKIDQASSQSAQLKEEVAEAQESLAAISKEQVEMDTMRREQNTDYKAAKADLEAGIAGVEKALGVLREYYGGAAAMIQQDDWSMMQQPAKPAAHSKSGGAGGSIIDILELCESDFSKDLAGEESAESDAQESYDKQTQENKIQKTMKEQDVKYKTQEFKSLDTELTELSGDKGTASKELAAVMEYYGKIKDRCIAKPETYEERTARRKAEIDGLKQAQQILDEQTAFSQVRKRRGLKVAKLGF
jgi:chromosome segregation ATPase